MGKTLVVVTVVVVLGGSAAAQPGNTQPVPPPPVLAPPPAAIAPPPAAAVHAEAPAPREYHAICVEGRPFECGSVFVLEAGLRGGTATTWTFDIGLLVNSGRYAVGATFGGMVYETPGNRTGDGSKLFKARVRRYLGDAGGAVDAAVGYDDDAASAEVALGYRDLIAITAGVHTVDGDPTQRYGANVGVRIGAETIGALIYIVGHLAGGR